MDPESSMQTLASSNNDKPQSEQGLLATITKNEVLEAVKMHKRFSIPSLASGVEVTDLPNFEDITQYEVSEQVQDQLWANEVTRLIEAVTSPAPLTFEGSTALAVDSKRSYEVVAAMADHVWQAVHIAIHDGESLLALHCKDLFKIDNLKSSQVVLNYLRSKEEEDNAMYDSGEVMPHYSREDFFNFVNYSTATLARVLCAVADGKSFHVHILAHLAKLSAKVKVLSTRVQECASISIANGVPDRGIPVLNQHDSRGWGVDLAFEPLLGMRGVQGELLLEPSRKEEFMRNVYFTQCSNYRRQIFDLFQSILAPLRGTRGLVKKPVMSYELCSIVYGTGFERFRTLVYQDHKNDFSGTSDTSMVNCARSSFDILDNVIQHVQTSAPTHHQPTTTTSGNSSDTKSQFKRIASDSGGRSIGTRISWSYAPDGHSSESVQKQLPLMLKSMSHVITVMIPFIMTSPAVVCSMNEFIIKAIFTEFQGEWKLNPIKPRAVGKYTAFFCLTTAEYDALQRIRAPDEPRSLSKALTWRNNLLAGRQLADIGRKAGLAFDPGEATWRASLGDDQTTQERIQRHQRELDRFRYKIKSCILQEKGIMVHCGLYVSLLILLCAALVAGGVSIGVVVGERITGVDPFNITTYCWVLAAFILLVAKSFVIQNWPWNDFLHGRVLCKSVSELSSVTGVNEQLILAKLLQDESISILKTRGPYNTVFNRKSEDGFSIDRPLSTWTMLQTGLIMIEVESTSGRGLVCLDLRRGTKYGEVQSMCSDEHQGDGFIHCARLPNEKDEEVHGDPNRVRLEKGKLFWLRTLGFYGNRHAEFI